MPRGAKPGERRGGKQKGTLNKATIEKAIIAERIVNEATMAGRKLGKEQVEEFMVLFAGLAASFQPTSTERTAIEAWAKTASEPLFEKYAKMSVACGVQLAEYQSPKMGRVQVPAPPPERGHGPKKREFSVSVFENGARQLPPPAKIAPPASTAKH